MLSDASCVVMLLVMMQVMTILPVMMQQVRMVMLMQRDRCDDNLRRSRCCRHGCCGSTESRGRHVGEERLGGRHGTWLGLLLRHGARVEIGLPELDHVC